jgi:hypothetical protein
VRPDAGYSGTPLIKKLGIKPGMHIAIIDAPEGYESTLGPLPDGVIRHNTVQSNLNFIHIFTLRSRQLRLQLPGLKTALAPDGMLWISWPKKASKVPSDLSGDVVRQMGLAIGLVDVKVAAVDAVWSGLKFVYRLADRKP